MTFPDLKFLDTGKQASAAELDQLEERLGQPLPGALRSWLQLHSDSMLNRKNNWIPMEAILGLPSSVSVEYMMSVEEIEETISAQGDCFPPHFVSFAHDGDGNYLLMSPDGGIYFWDWRIRIDVALEAAMNDCTLKVADSLSAFLSLLGPGPLSED